MNQALPALLIAWVWALWAEAPARPGRDLVVTAALGLLVGRYLSVFVLSLGLAMAEIWQLGISRVLTMLFSLGLTGNAAGLAVILLSIGSRVA